MFNITIATSEAGVYGNIVTGIGSLVEARRWLTTKADEAREFGLKVLLSSDDSVGELGYLSTANPDGSSELCYEIVIDEAGPCNIHA